MNNTAGAVPGWAVYRGVFRLVNKRRAKRMQPDFMGIFWIFCRRLHIIGMRYAAADMFRKVPGFVSAVWSRRTGRSLRMRNVSL